MTWQPIERSTGPRDGKWVLVWWPHVTDAPFAAYRQNDVWHDAPGGETWQEGPTHWMPLPGPPK